MSVSRAHETCDWLETAIKKVLAGAVVAIHVEPDKANFGRMTRSLVIA
jgi:divalent metal cation (Fe/Co/Zn/Cd) transporter